MSVEYSNYYIIEIINYTKKMQEIDFKDLKLFYKREIFNLSFLYE